MEMNNDQPRLTNMALFYSRAGEVLDPLMRGKGLISKGKIFGDKIKGKKWEYSTISSTNKYQNSVPENSIGFSFCSIFGEPA